MSQTGKILAHLRRYGSANNEELCNLGGWRFGARLHDLRRKYRVGILTVQTPVKGKLYLTEYVLIRDNDSIVVTQDYEIRDLAKKKTLTLEDIEARRTPETFWEMVKRFWE